MHTDNTPALPLHWEGFSPEAIVEIMKLEFA